MATPFKWRRRRGGGGSHSLDRKFSRRFRGYVSRKFLFRFFLITLAAIAILPPVYFHFSLRRFHQAQLKKCRWLNNPPLVCAHGGDASKAFPNTMAAYHIALRSQVDCIEIDVSRSADGVLFALHDRDLQRISGNTSSKVGYLSAKEGFSRAHRTITACFMMSTTMLILLQFLVCQAAEAWCACPYIEQDMLSPFSTSPFGKYSDWKGNK